MLGARGLLVLSGIWLDPRLVADLDPFILLPIPPWRSGSLEDPEIVRKWFPRLRHVSGMY